MRDSGVGVAALAAALALALAPQALALRAQGADPVSADQAGEPFAFARAIDRVAELELPPSSRPPLEAGALKVSGPFQLLRTADGLSTWAAPLPFRPRSLFFFKPLPGMSAKDAAGKSLSFATLDKKPKARTWAFDATTFYVRLPAEASAPTEIALAYPGAIEREEALNLDYSGLEPRAFAARSLQIGTDTRTGLLLPAPAKAAWDLRLPTAATLQLDATLVPPEADTGLRSDGATVVVSLEVGGQSEEVLRQGLDVGEIARLRVDLSDWAGQDVRVQFRTEGGATDTLDYVFLAEPTVYTPVTQPRKLLLVFLDTMRQDHLGVYGYDRPTTPTLDAWSRGAVVFENARSVAPWTLPSSRAILSGRQPERWSDGPTLAERLARAGWATGAFIGNVYLSSNFDMADGWSQHTCSNWPLAEVQVDRARDFLSRYDGRDVAMLVHTMDTHVPYTEPNAYRYLWAGRPPGGLGEGPLRSSVLSAARKDKDAVRQWMIDRYDQNIRYLDDQIGALIAEMGPDTTVVIFADHGEEFWDHGDFEHGHSLYDELLRVPLIVYDPTLAAGRVTAPVSVLDITPTVLELLGMEGAKLDGRSLVPLARGDAEALAAFEARPQAIGRPLYGDERWGVIDGSLKWTTTNGHEDLYDLVKDPAESRDLTGNADVPDQAALRARMGEALATEAPLSWRVEVGKGETAQVIELRHPKGFTAAWLGADPLSSADMSVSGPDADGVVRLKMDGRRSSSRELYLVPAGPPEELGGLSISAKDGQKEAPADLVVDLPNFSSGTLWTTKTEAATFTVTWGFAPVPPGATELDASDPELDAALQALGYQERDE